MPNEANRLRNFRMRLNEAGFRAFDIIGHSAYRFINKNSVYRSVHFLLCIMRQKFPFFALKSRGLRGIRLNEAYRLRNFWMRLVFGRLTLTFVLTLGSNSLYSSSTPPLSPGYPRCLLLYHLGNPWWLIDNCRAPVPGPRTQSTRWHWGWRCSRAPSCPCHCSCSWSRPEGPRRHREEGFWPSKQCRWQTWSTS